MWGLTENKMSPGLYGLKGAQGPKKNPVQTWFMLNLRPQSSPACVRQPNRNVGRQNVYNLYKFLWIEPFSWRRLRGCCGWRVLNIIIWLDIRFGFLGLSSGAQVGEIGHYCKPSFFNKHINHTNMSVWAMISAMRHSGTMHYWRCIQIFEKTNYQVSTTASRLDGLVSFWGTGRVTHQGWTCDGCGIWVDDVIVARNEDTKCIIIGWLEPKYVTCWSYDGGILIWNVQQSLGWLHQFNPQPPLVHSRLRQTARERYLEKSVKIRTTYSKKKSYRKRLPERKP